MLPMALYSRPGGHLLPSDQPSYTSAQGRQQAYSRSSSVPSRLAHCRRANPQLGQQLVRQQCRRQRHGAAAVAAALPGGQEQLAPPSARVFRATCPLVGLEPFEQALGRAFPPALHMHHFVVLELLPPGMAASSSSSSSSSGSSGSTVTAFDFLPADPTSPLTAATLLSGGTVQGIMRCRPLRGVPRLRCQLQGTTRLADPLAAAAAFQQQYHTGLQLLRNDCTHHTDRLVACLLGTGGGSGSGSSSGGFGSSSSSSGGGSAGSRSAVG